MLTFSKENVDYSLLVFTLFFCLLSPDIKSQVDRNNIPSIGDRVSGVVSLEQEKQIGEYFLTQIYAQAPLIDDPLVKEFAELLVYRISETSRVQNREFKVVLIDDKSLNAFAAPGGIIGINAGLFLHADNEAQFASVITHELAHVSQRHFARGVLRGQDTNIASALVLISSIALAIVTNNPTAFIAGPAALAQQQLRYSRVFEREADRFGFNNLINAGYDPKSMGEMFENMSKISRLSGDLPPEFLLSHPVTSSRISDAFNAADQSGIDGGKINSPDYQLIKGRIEAKYFNVNASPESYFEDLYSKNQNLQNTVSLITTYSKNRKFEKANNLLDKLLSSFPKNLILKTIEGEIYFLQDDLNKALEVVNQILTISPNNYPASILKVKILSNKKEYLFAEQILRDQLLKKNKQPELWLLLSEIQRASKNIVGYHISKGEYFILIGKYDDALNELQFALRLVQNNFQVSESIMTKINEIKRRKG